MKALGVDAFLERRCDVGTQKKSLASPIPPSLRQGNHAHDVPSAHGNRGVSTNKKTIFHNLIKSSEARVAHGTFQEFFDSLPSLTVGNHGKDLV